MNSPGQTITEALHTITLLLYIYIYIYIYIYKGEEPSWSIDHRGLAYSYTAFIYIYIYIFIYIREMNPPGQLITEALNTTTLLIYIW